MLTFVKKPTNYAADRAWCSKWLARGTPVWCVRMKTTGVTVAFVAHAIQGWTSFQERPVDDYTVQQMVMRGGLAWFGPESAWPRRTA